MRLFLQHTVHPTAQLVTKPLATDASRTFMDGHGEYVFSPALFVVLFCFFSANASCCSIPFHPTALAAFSSIVSEFDRLK
jgi:hypothetical protein